VSLHGMSILLALFLCGVLLLKFWRQVLAFTAVGLLTLMAYGALATLHLLQ